MGGRGGSARKLPEDLHPAVNLAHPALPLTDPFQTLISFGSPVSLASRREGFTVKRTKGVSGWVRGVARASSATSYSQDKVAADVRMKEKESAAAVNLSFSFRTPATS